MKAFRVLATIAIILFFVCGIFSLYSTLTDYCPAPEETVFQSIHPSVIDDSTAIGIVSWNIAYCGLGKEMDFFYDGGKKVRDNRPNVVKNFDYITKFLDSRQNFPFIILQEVDIHSKRSYYFNEFDSLLIHMKGYELFFGKNYQVDFVPVPLYAPMGKVESGIVTASRYTPVSVVRHTYPFNFSWPKKAFMLDRCFLVARYLTSNGKQLLIINNHNSTYDGGKLSNKELSFLKSFILNEYEQGNYVITGGDWNMSPPGFRPSFKSDYFDTTSMTYIPMKIFPEGWTWVYDSTTPSNRWVDMPYVKGKTKTTVIDQFLVSPNIEVCGVKTLDLGFAASDHQPVVARFKLHPESVQSGNTSSVLTFQ